MIDANTVDEIRVRHEDTEARQRKYPAMDFGQVHADRGVLLDIIARLQTRCRILGETADECASEARHLRSAIGERPRRPLAGPWVRATLLAYGRYGASGEEIGYTCPLGNGWSWHARRPFREMARGTAKTDEEARRAVDAVVQEWADLGDEAAKLAEFG